MKKLSLIAAALTSALVISMAGVPASAAANEQYVTVEDGVTVVHVIVYVEPDSAIKGSEVVSYDANGTKYVYTYKVRPQSPEDAKQLTRRGLANMVYPAGYTKINNVANTWAPEITSILAAHGYRFVYNASMNGLNEYYDRDGQQVDRDTFWANFKW